jgi:NAD(P)-dependent dehydrogenase (short-subunit alcohol dehydrogenase family)
MKIEFYQQTVLVTGAAHGFGRAIALVFASRGAQVWACDLLTAELAETRQLCTATACSFLLPNMLAGSAAKCWR